LRFLFAFAVADTVLRRVNKSRFGEETMARKIPPLNALRAFEAASRSGSFTTAAVELSVSLGAISRHIAHLEQVLEVRLFERGHRTVSLTDAGAQYAASVQAALDEIEQATARVKAPSHIPPVRVRAFPNFVFRWLMPRLATFQHAHPDIAVEFIAAEEAPLAERDPVDLAIQIHSPLQVEMTNDRLFPLAIIPICTRSTAAKIGAIASPTDLRKATLLHSAVRRTDWRRWFAGAGSTGPIDDDGLEFSNSSLTYEAAVNGLGVAMAQREHAKDDLASGRLVSPWPFALETGEFYRLVSRKETSAHVATFRGWMLAATRATDVSARLN
jgi:LysR family glycine cleavage system transcriptional activator